MVRCSFGSSSVLFSALAVLFATPAGAAELRWEDSNECARQDAVVRRIESLVGRDLASVDGIRFEVSVQQSPNKLRLRVVTVPTHGSPNTRWFEGKTCDEVSDAAAVAMAMAIRAEAPAEDLPSKPPAREASVEAQPDVSPSLDRGPQPEAPRVAPSTVDRQLVHAAFGAAMAADSSALPGVAAGVDVGAALVLPYARLEARGVLFPPRARAVEGDRGGQFSLLAGALFACATLAERRALGCVGYELGRISGEGTGVRHPLLGAALWQSVRLEAGLAWPISTDLRLTLRAGVSLPIDRPEFQLDGSAVHQPGAVAVRAAVGVEFWR
jgi:hypothetical protein